MPLEPAIRRRLNAIARLGFAPVEQQTPEQIRQSLDQMVAQLGPPDLSGLAVSHLEIAAEATPLPLRIYQPEQGSELPALVYFHGGGWLNGTLDSHDRICSLLAREAQAAVVSVAYRRTPEHPFPAAPADCLAATEWVFRESRQLRVDTARIFAAGDSAGGNLAAVVALQRRDQALKPDLAGQILLWPATSYYLPPTQSYFDYGEDCGLTHAGMIYFWDRYLTDPEDARNPYACPLAAPDLTRLPPALVITAEYDVLRDEGDAYARRLTEAGVPVESVCVAGVNHGFAAWPDADFNLPQARETRARIARFVNATRP